MSEIDTEIIPAIAVIGYNRIDSMKRLLNSLAKADYPAKEIPLIISLDKSGLQEELIQAAEAFQWKYGEKIILPRAERMGLRHHIIENGNLSLKYGAVLILEDDLVVAPDFYHFIDQAVNYYKDDPAIAGIGLYSHEWNGYASAPFDKYYGDADVFAGQFSITWGQCWTAEQWSGFISWYQKNQEYVFNDSIPERINRWSDQSWGKYFVNYIVKNDLYYIIPMQSLSTNFSEVGQHSPIPNTVHQVGLWMCRNRKFKLEPLGRLRKYDIFFEPVFEEKIHDIETALIDIDLNVSKGKKRERPYLLTTKKLDYKIVTEYGLEMRPMELNVLYQNPGKGIYLYDTRISCKNHDKNKYAKELYDLRGFHFLQLIPLAAINMRQVVRIKLKLLIKKRKRKHL